MSTFLTGFVTFAISYTGLIIPVYSELNKIARYIYVHFFTIFKKYFLLNKLIRSAGYPNDLRTQGLISGLFGAIHSLGALIGPILGGFLVDKIGFNNTTGLVVIMFIIVVSGSTPKFKKN